MRLPELTETRGGRAHLLCAAVVERRRAGPGLCLSLRRTVHAVHIHVLHVSEGQYWFEECAHFTLCRQKTHSDTRAGRDGERGRGRLVEDGPSASPDCRQLLPAPFAAAAASEASGPGSACSSQRSLRRRTPSPPSVR